MDTKHIHCMLEKMAEYGKCMIEEGAGSGNVNLEDAKRVVEMVGELAEAEYHALIAREMRKAHEEEESEEKYFLKMLKEEYGMGDEEARRFYRGQPRSKTSGRYMSPSDRRRNERLQRLGYEEPMYHMMPDMYAPGDLEYYRDMDRMDGKMYYTDGRMNGNMANSADSGNRTGGNMIDRNSGGSIRGYSDGYNDGSRKGYEEGYSAGQRSGGGIQGRDMREGRSGQRRRSYMETKEMHKGNSPEDKKQKMTELEKYMGELSGDITEMIADASNEEKTMLKSKLATLAQKIV